MDDQHTVEVAPRSIRILNTVTSNKPVRNRKKKANKTKAEVPAAADAVTESVPVKEQKDEKE